jgi:hypothetical protein
MSEADGRGEVFRYKQTGRKPDKVPPGGDYSEIGFYHRKTQWKASEIDKPTYKDTDKDIPEIDQINIHSTGDIHTRAKNHHRMKAKRIEILSEVEESDFSQDLEGKNRPFGDKGADISQLLKGDIHIRGKRRIVLKAGSEIRLEVGRSSIVVSDTGIAFTTRKTHSDIQNSLDTILMLRPMEGVIMFGQHIKLSAAYDWGIQENMGSAIKGTAGIIRLEGKDIKASTMSGAAYIVNFIAQTLAFGTNLASMSIGTHDSDNVQESALPSYVGLGMRAAAILVNMGIGLSHPETGAIDDPNSKIVEYTTLILENLYAVISVIETLYSPEDEKGKDALALASIIAEFGCLIPIFGAICAASVGPFMLHNDSVHLGNNGELAMVGAKIKQFSTNNENVNSSLSGFNPPQEGGDKKWHEKVRDFVKNYWVRLTFAALIGGSGVGFGVYRMISLEKEKEKLLKELNEL